MRFLHLADAHLDRPFSGIQDMPDSMAKLCLKASQRAFDRAVALALENQVDAVLMVGDMFDTARRGVEASLFLRDRLKRLAESEIPTFLVHGNHDPLDASLSRVSWPSGVHVFPAEDVYQMALKGKDGIECHLYGISFASSLVTENLSTRFPKERTAEVMMGLIHANVGGRSGHQNYAPCKESHLHSKAIDYWALGHIHKREIFLEDRPKAAYPGMLQGAHIGELGEGGALLVDIGPTGPVQTEFVPLSEVVWHDVQVQIESLADVGELEDAVVQALNNTHPGPRIVRVIVTGRGPVHNELMLRVDQESLLEALRAAVLDLGECWIAKLVNETKPELDLEAFIKEETFTGELLRVAAQLNPGKDMPAQLSERLDVLYANPSFSRLVSPLDSLDWNRIVDMAQTMVLDRLLKDITP